jgi:hypothetical protein
MKKTMSGRNILSKARILSRKLEAAAKRTARRSPAGARDVATVLGAGAAAAYLVEEALDAAIEIVDTYYNVPPEK